jgi:hypothetical protein
MLKIIRPFVVVSVIGLIVFLLPACQKEVSFEKGINNSKNCINCDYLPVCDSSYFEYVDSTANGIDTNKNIVTVLSDTTINSTRFHRVNTLGFFDNGLLYNCDAQQYKIVLNFSDLGFDPADIIDSLLQGFPFPTGTITLPSQAQVIILKANVNAGDTWVDNLYKLNNPLFNIQLDMKHTLLQKLSTKNVLGKNYNDVIEVRSAVHLSLPQTPPSVYTTLNIFYTKGVGVIESSVTNEQGAIVQTRKLYQHKL